MADEVLWAIRVLKVATVLLGSVIVYLAYRGYQRNHSRAMFTLSAGFGLITLGAVTEGVLFEFLGFELLQARLAEAVTTALGFFIVIYSVFGRR
ncbi:MAG: hypothetical protein ACE5IB_03805 [Candidatus Geothermarchaeales archaeon]